MSEYQFLGFLKWKPFCYINRLLLKAFFVAFVLKRCFLSTVITFAQNHGKFQFSFKLLQANVEPYNTSKFPIGAPFPNAAREDLRFPSPFAASFSWLISNFVRSSIKEGYKDTTCNTFCQYLYFCKHMGEYIRARKFKSAGDTMESLKHIFHFDI